MNGIASENKTTSLDLRWSKGYSFQQLLANDDLRKEFNCPGVYLHLDNRRSEGERAAYVGKASGAPSLWRRQYDHYVHYIGGLYVIPESTQHENSYTWTPGPDNEKTRSTVFCREAFHEIVDLAFDYVQTVTIHLCKLPTAGEAKIVERRLLWDLEPIDTTAGTKTRPKDVRECFHDCSDAPELRLLLARTRR